MKRVDLRRSLYCKVVAVMLVIIFVAVLVPYGVFNWAYRKATIEDVRKQITLSLKSAADYLTENNLPLSDLPRLYGDGGVWLEVCESPESLELGEDALRQLEQGGQVVFAKFPGRRSSSFVAALRYGDAYILWQMRADGMLKRMHRTGLFSLAASVLLGTLIALVAGKRMTRPIRELEEATRKVAAGDFSQRLENPYTDEIGSLIKSFNIMTRELGSVEMLRSDFVSDISHEFKTPLTAIEGYAKLLDGEEDPKERSEYIQIIVEETGRLSTLAQNILTLNKLEKGNLPREWAKVRLDEQIRRALALCAPKWEAKGLDLELELDEAQVNGLEPLLMQVWTNLVDNAVKFSPQGGKIWVTLKSREGRAVFSIQDEGPGIPQEDLGHIFEKFYKGDKSRGSDGNGLGLSIVRQVAGLHGGSVCAENDGGARFTVVL